MKRTLSSLDGGTVPDSILERQKESWLAGNNLPVEELLRGTPHEGDSEAELDLLYHEIVVQEELGISVSPDDYLRRYPHLKDELELHFEVHRAMSGSLLDTARPESDLSWPENGPLSISNGNVPAGYELIREMGHGGMAAVYEARHERLRRHVALKLFERGRRLTSRETSRIRTEAEAMARLAHPNIIQIYEIGAEGDSSWLSLELAEQGTLAQKLQQFPFTPAAAAELIETLARALHHAHERQVVHRDLKPANILFTRDGTPKITDFGLAKVFEDRDIDSADATQTGEAVGTPRYMAPEQAAGLTAQIGPATDVYALGTLLYECLTGRAPFVSASVVETLQRIRSDDPQPPRRLQPGIPRDLETICLRCLEKDPQRRFATAVDLADELQRFRRGEPIRSRPITMAERTWKWCRRRPTQAMLVSIAVLLVLAGATTAAARSHFERERLSDLRNEIALLVREGQTALENDELESAQEKFTSAWRIVQAEPALIDHATSVSGWMDHARNALGHYQWKQRVPPRDFDERRDEALLLSLLIVPSLPEPLEAARDAIREALELTVAGEELWQLEREWLILIDSDLVERQTGPAAAIERLKSGEDFASSEPFEQQADWLNQLGRADESKTCRARAAEYPPRRVPALLRAGLSAVRRKAFDDALISFETVLESEPDHFAARLFQAICFLKLDRPREARVALTACVAQRPRFAWNYYFRAQTLNALGDVAGARKELERVLEGRASAAARQATLDEMKLLTAQKQ